MLLVLLRTAPKAKLSLAARSKNMFCHYTYKVYNTVFLTGLQQRVLKVAKFSVTA